MGTLVQQIGHFLIILFTFVVCVCSGSNNMGVCKEGEKRALLCFKKELEGPKNLLPSWVDGVDCCNKWEGVLCDNVTGHVVRLQPAYFTWGPVLGSQGKLSSCLLELKQLRHLDLSGLSYYFKGSHIPSFVGSLTNLQYLDLSRTGFQGIIPHQLGNLSSLHTLRLEYLKADSLDWLSRLSNLQVLDFTSIDLSMAHNWPEVINMLPFLRELLLYDCDLPNKLSHPLGRNNSSLRVLDLSNNEFNTVIPRWIFNLNNLVSLSLSGCSLLSPLPNGPWNLTNLNFLDLSNNEMNGSLPSQLFGLNHLKGLEISWNQFQNPVPSDSLNLNLTSLENLQASNYHVNSNEFNSHIPNWIYDCTNLEILDLSENQLQGTISNSISNLTSLSDLDLDGNMLTGEILKQIGKLNRLQTLYLSRNKFNGTLPESFGYLFPMMEELDISNNMLEGIVTERHYVNLTMLRIFSASGNRLTLNVSPNWTPPFQLDWIYLSGWSLGPRFPAWLQSQHRITDVDISNAGIEGEIPTWFWNFSSQILTVNLSHNQLRGRIQNISFPSPQRPLVYLGSNQFVGLLPHISSDIRELDLSRNFFSGDVYHFLCHAENVSNNLEILHLGRNDLFGEIPNCWTHWPRLRVIYMMENKFIGIIPNSIGLLNQLQSLDLHKNMLSGPIPSSLQNCTNLFKVDLGENRFTGKIPRWMGPSLSNLRILRLRSNMFYGEIYPEFCHLTSLQILDLSNNNLFGVIPRCVKNLTAMVNEKDIQEDVEFETGYSYFGGDFGESALVTTKGNEYEYDTIVLSLFAGMDLSSNNFEGDIPIELTNLVGLRSLNLSRNNLTGNIPKDMGNMKLLESLDLSRNHLSGEIPSSFASLYGLGVMDLSYNNLSGKIPSGTQLQGFNASCYIGNNLCGLPISRNCSVDDGEIPEDENKEDDSLENDGFYISMAIGFVVGFWGICGFLLLVRSWWIAYFQFLDKKIMFLLAWAHALRAYS